MTIHLPNPRLAAAWCSEQRQLGKTIGYIPTMGALHQGHLSLIQQAASENDLCCVSIFVNPLQFNDLNDLDTYPQDLDTDIELLRKAGCHMVYTGTISGFFPEVEHIGQIETRDSGPASKGLEGTYRPGHLEGVYQIVERLFATVGTCRAYFGEKDFQQTLVVKHLAKKMKIDGMGIEVVVCPTVREPSGLAMSSRNTRLSIKQLETAKLIFQSLSTAKNAWQKGIRIASTLEEIMIDVLDHCELKIEYVAVRDPNAWTLHRPDHPLNEAQALIAAYLGSTRLIDNIRLNK
ncbi:MAG: pantoate--beta-alanine ligase [Gammaproteobacteria bacterium]|nr:pantoate--beta-alanine ligase [Gammaproteobacteria bacterium]